ncbi:unnamed protein product [Closterium sp. NIES-53]
MERVEEVLEFVHMSVLSSFDRACLDAMAAAAAKAQQHTHDQNADGSSSFSFPDSSTDGPASDFRAAGAGGEVGLAQMAELASVVIEREAGGMVAGDEGRTGKGGRRGRGEGGEGGAAKGGCVAVFRRLGVYGTAAVAAAALHQQLDSQLDPFLSVVSELHPDCCKVFYAVDAFDRRVQRVVQGEVRAEEEEKKRAGEGHGGYGHAAQIASELNPYQQVVQGEVQAEEEEEKKKRASHQGLLAKEKENCLPTSFSYFISILSSPPLHSLLHPSPQIDPVMKRLFSAWVSAQQQKLHVWMERGVEAEVREREGREDRRGGKAV